MDSGTAAAPGAAPRLVRSAETVLPTQAATFRLLGYAGGDVEHLALVLGDVAAGAGDDEPAGPAPLVRVHSECLTGDALGSLRCDCGDQLQAAQHAVAADGRGVVVYLRGHEGRGIGLLPKLAAYALQDGGLDTLDANTALGHPGDARRYDAAAAVLADLGVRRVRLLTSNPAKAEQLRGLGVEVEAMVPLPVPQRPENAGYLATKRARMRHLPVPAASEPG